MKLITNPSMARWLWLSALVVVLDQVTKWLAVAMLPPYRPVPLLPHLSLTLMYNEGAAFSFLAAAGGWQRWLFTGFALLMSLVLVIWLLRLGPGERLMAASLSLVVGGAVGNLVDRFYLGHVVDFVDFFVGNWHWPAFNLADSAISVGVVLLLLSSLGGGQGEQDRIS
jgi:signal peptidase II